MNRYMLIVAFLWSAAAQSSPNLSEFLSAVNTIAQSLSAPEPSASLNSQAYSAFTLATIMYMQSLYANPSFVQELGEIGNTLVHADPSIVDALNKLFTQTIYPTDLTSPPAYITAIPSPYNSLFDSVYSHERDLAVQYGLLPTSFMQVSTSSSEWPSANSPSPTAGPTSTSLTSASSRAAATSLSDSSISSTGDTTASSATPAVPSDNELPGSAKLGIGLGVGIGGVVLIVSCALTFMLWKRSKQDKRRSEKHDAGPGIIAFDDQPGVAVS